MISPLKCQHLKSTIVCCQFVQSRRLTLHKWILTRSIKPRSLNLSCNLQIYCNTPQTRSDSHFDSIKYFFRQFLNHFNNIDQPSPAELPLTSWHALAYMNVKAGTYWELKAPIDRSIPDHFGSTSRYILRS